MMDKIILTDVDGVLLDWNTGFDKFMNFYQIQQIMDQSNRYSLGKRYGQPRHFVDKMVVEFNQSERNEVLEPLADAVEYVSKLSEEGYRFIAITNVGSDPLSKQRRAKNLMDVFGDVFKGVICLGVGESKYLTLSRWENSGFHWIEDKFTNALDGHSLGLNSILVDAEYNKDFSTTRFPRVSSTTPWKEIYKIVNS